MTENEIVYVRVCKQGTISVKFIGCMSTEKADAKGILNTIEHAVQVTGLKCNELLQKVVVLDFNGASVMTGVPKGVAALLKETNACIVSIHCFGQRLELAYKESLTKVALGEKVVTLLIGLYYFYHNSPLNCSNLRSSFKALTISITTAHLTAIICEVALRSWARKSSYHLGLMGRGGWPIVQRALTNLLRGYEALLLHLQQLVNSLKVFATAKCKVQCFLKFLTKRDIMQFAALLHDVVSALSVMSQVFQRKDGTAADIH